MRTASLFFLSLTSLGAAFTVAALSAPPHDAAAIPTTAESFKVDPVHSNVIFKVKHRDASYFYGRFAKFSGTFTYDEKNPANCEVVMEVEAESIDTRTAKLDDHLRSPDFFDAKQFPSIIFESTDVKKGSRAGTYAVTGDLTLHGVTKSVTIELEHTGSSEGRRGTVVGFHTVFTIDRTDFGMEYGVGGGVGKDVELTISIEAGQG